MALNIVLWFWVLIWYILPNTFLQTQLRYERVRKAKAEKEAVLKQMLQKHQLTLNNFQMLIVAYKEEKQLDLYAKSSSASKYTLVKTYTICDLPGYIGPKQQQGDARVPEGFYFIDRFNPSSNFYLSLGINYPNQADKLRNAGGNLGGDIFIHGSCVTVGCLPMTDEYIKEIYLAAVYARSNGQEQIPVYIFPFKMEQKKVAEYQKQHPEWRLFWSNLQEGYTLFNSHGKELKLSFDNQGKYQF